jgi:hypothetical protein
MSYTEEKPPGVEGIEDIVERASTEDEEFTPAEQKKILRRIDLRLVTMTGLAYCISLMDRTNLSAAAIAGYEPMEFDVNRWLTGTV